MRKTLSVNQPHKNITNESKEVFLKKSSIAIVGITIETVKVITFHQYEKVNLKPQFNTTFQEVNALAFTREMIKHDYRDRWNF
jgi:hypothetical protein